MENLQNKKISDFKESIEKQKILEDFYGETIENLSRYFYEKAEDSIKYIQRQIYELIKDNNDYKDEKEYIYNIMNNLLENKLKNFKTFLDKGELAMKDSLDYINLIEKINKDNSNEDINNRFIKTKNNFLKKLQENLKLKILINIQKNISKLRNDYYEGNKQLENKIILLNKVYEFIENYSFDILDENLKAVNKNLQNLNNKI
jgi:hypothetical protein